MLAKGKRRRVREPKLHRIADKLTEILIHFIIIFSPWAFGSTENWSIWTMNIATYSLGGLLLIKWLIRRKKGFCSPEFSENNIRLSIFKYSNYISLFLIITVLVYILISAINPRASFDLNSHSYTYFEGYKPYLPHSYDSKATWFLFYQYVGLFILFFATKDWLLQKSANKNRRLTRLIFLICINCGILGIECIAQRYYFTINDIGDTGGRLLFLIEPSIAKINTAQFGPFAYRSNASTYFNLVWPIGIGFIIQQTIENAKNYKLGSSPYIILFPFVIISAACPIISSARGGALIMLGLIIPIIIILYTLRTGSRQIKILIPSSILVILFIGYFIGWEKLESRLIESFTDNLSNRIQGYQTISSMITNYGFFGSGPGTFETVYQFESNGDGSSWLSWAHNDYLEFLLTFGYLGFSILILLIGVEVFKLILIFKYMNNIILNIFITLSISGVFIHAIGDFPLQVYSILSLLIIIWAAQTSSYKIYK